MGWCALLWEFSKSLVTVPVTIAGVWFAFRLESRRRALDEFTAQLAILKRQVNGVAGITVGLLDHLDSTNPPDQDATRRALVMALSSVTDEAMTAHALSMRLPRRWYQAAHGLSLVSLNAALGAMDTMVQPPSGPGIHQWMADWHSRLSKALRPCDNASHLWLNYLALGPKRARAQLAEDYGPQAVPPRRWRLLRL